MGVKSTCNLRAFTDYLIILTAHHYACFSFSVIIKETTIFQMIYYLLHHSKVFTFPFDSKEKKRKRGIESYFRELFVNYSLTALN